MSKSEVIQAFLSKGYLVSPDLIDADLESSKSFLESLGAKIKSKEKPLIINKDLFLAVTSNGVIDINWSEFEKSKVLFEKKNINKMYDTFLDILNPNFEKTRSIKIEPSVSELKRNDVGKEAEQLNHANNVVVLKQFDLPSKKINIKDFVNYFECSA